MKCGFISLSILGILFFSASLFAQSEKKMVRQGNRLYEKENFSESEAAYKKALEKKGDYEAGVFNLGDAMYKQERYEDAKSQFELAAKLLVGKENIAKAFHNLGNTYLEEKKYQESANAYKEALKLYPDDLETKYNLAYANLMQKQNPQDQQQQDQKQDEKEDQQEDQEQNQDDQQQDQQQQDQQQQDQQEQQSKEEKEEQNQQQQPRDQLSKEEAERMLEALKNEEQKVQEKMQRKMMTPVQIQIEKDW